MACLLACMQALHEQGRAICFLKIISPKQPFLFFRVANESGAPAETQRAELLYNRWLLDIPKLLDIAALYGPDNPEVMRQFMTKVQESELPLLVMTTAASMAISANWLVFARQVFTLQPMYGNDVTDLVPTLVSNFMDVCSALQDAAHIFRNSRDMSVLRSLMGMCLVQRPHRSSWCGSLIGWVLRFFC